MNVDGVKLLLPCLGRNLHEEDVGFDTTKYKAAAKYAFGMTSLLKHHERYIQLHCRKTRLFWISMMKLSTVLYL